MELQKLSSKSQSSHNDIATANTPVNMLTEQNLDRQTEGTQGISIGSNNRIKNSIFAGNITDGVKSQQKGFYGRHPVVCSIVISFVVGFLLMFRFWSNIINFLEGLF